MEDDIREALAVIQHYVFVPAEAKAAQINALIARLEAHLNKPIEPL